MPTYLGPQGAINSTRLLWEKRRNEHDRSSEEVQSRSKSRLTYAAALCYHHRRRLSVRMVESLPYIVQTWKQSCTIIVHRRRNILLWKFLMPLQSSPMFVNYASFGCHSVRTIRVLGAVCLLLEINMCARSWLMKCRRTALQCWSITPVTIR